MPHTQSACPQSSNKFRQLALTMGLVLGMVAGSFISTSVQAATSTKAKSKKTSTKKKTTKKAAAAAVILTAATSEQLQAAQHVHTGQYHCELGKALHVEPYTKAEGYFSLQLDKKQWVMKPVLTSTGTIRLEDSKNSVMLMQILTKSMLMDKKAGRRLVDGCVHASQQAAQEQLLHHPQPSNF